MFLPFLQSKINHSWVDPRKSKSDKSLLYEYKLGWAMAQAAEEFLGFIDETADAVDTLEKKSKGEIVDKVRESLS